MRRAELRSCAVDLVFVGILVVFFLASGLLALACDRF